MKRKVGERLMDGTTGRPDGIGSYIWLRYTTQFQVGERINTIEIGVPVPLGASEETRERLFREATAGMDQLAKHVESHAARVQHTRQRGSTVPAAKLPAAPPSIPAAAAPANRSSTPPVAQPASVSSPKTPAEKPLSENMTDVIGETRSSRPAANSNATPAASVLMHPANKKAPDILEIRHAVVREVPPSPAFDEELEDEELGLDVGDEEDLDYLSELTEHERDFAEDRLSKLREARGSSAASPVRLQALNNVINEQLTKEQLLELIQGIWNVATLNKLKNEQVEALIS